MKWVWDCLKPEKANKNKGTFLLTFNPGYLSIDLEENNNNHFDMLISVISKQYKIGQMCKCEVSILILLSTSWQCDFTDQFSRQKK